MEKTNFIDYIRVFCRSGHGGAGSRHFMRTKFNPQAGPDGGDGGRGGHIILRGNKNLWTLLHLRYYKNVHAENGEGGSGNNSSGKAARMLSLKFRSELLHAMKNQEKLRQKYWKTDRNLY